MSKANVIRGRIEAHGQGEGLVNEEDVQARAREIAVTNGRRPEQMTQADLAQARQELRGAQNGPVDDSDLDQSELIPMDDAAVGESWGRHAPTKLATDEQTLPEDLVGEGVEEATHEQLVEGNRESRRRDEHFEDQLPGT